MVNKPLLRNAEQAYGGAFTVVEHMGSLAGSARGHRRGSGSDGKIYSVHYAMATRGMVRMEHALTLPVRYEARKAYPPGSPVIRLVKDHPASCVIEAIADGLAPLLRNLLHANRQHPLEPDVSAIVGRAFEEHPGEHDRQCAFIDEAIADEKRAIAAEYSPKQMTRMMFEEWNAQDPALLEEVIDLLRCGSVDFKDLKIQLERESITVLEGLRRPGLGATNTSSDEPLPGAIHYAILDVLKKQGRLRKGKVIQALSGDYGETLGYAAIQELHSWGFVYAPPGKHEVGILQAGLDCLELHRKAGLRQARPPQS